MTPREFAKRECANLSPHGSCFGFRPEDLINDGQQKWTQPKQNCLFANDSLQRCRYFEKLILPLTDKLNPKGESRLQTNLVKARKKYWDIVEKEQLKITFDGAFDIHFKEGDQEDIPVKKKTEKIPNQKIRMCSLCNKVPLPKFKHYCPACAKKKQQENYYKWKGNNKQYAISAS